MFSVLISLYAKENPDWLSEALTSVLIKQNIGPTEVVLVADGSLTPELDDVVSRFKDTFSEVVVVHRLPVNSGLGHALNEGLQICRFDIVARMDTDDIAHPERFEKQLAFMQSHPDVDVVGSYAEDMDENGKHLGIRTVPTEHEQMHRVMWTCPLIHPSVMFKKSVILNAGSYSKTLKRRQDYDLWFRCAQSGARFANIPEALIRYRITDNTYARNSLKVAWQQAIIGFKGCRELSLGAKAHIGVFYPVVKALLPLKARKGLERIIKKFDPRGK